MSISLLIAIALGGSFGAILRFLISNYINRVISSPYGTLGVNILGSFIIGFLFLYFEQNISPNLKAFLITGLLGALTTFSTFSLESYLLFESQLYVKAILNILLNVTLSLGATLLGVLLYKKIYGL
jgi:CrcB protein